VIAYVTTRFAVVQFRERKNAHSECISMGMNVELVTVRKSERTLFHQPIS